MNVQTRTLFIAEKGNRSQAYLIDQLREDGIRR